MVNFSGSVLAYLLSFRTFVFGEYVWTPPPQEKKQQKSNKTRRNQWIVGVVLTVATARPAGGHSKATAINAIRRRAATVRPDHLDRPDHPD